MNKIDRIGVGFSVVFTAGMVAMFVAALAIVWKVSLVVIGFLLACYSIGYIIDEKTGLDAEFDGDMYP